MSKNKVAVFAIFGAVTLALIGFLSIQFMNEQVKASFKTAPQERTSPRPKSTPSQKIRKMQQEATLIQEGVMTDKEKVHSKLFKEFDDVTKGKKLREMIQRQDEVNIGRLIGNPLLPASFSLDDYIRDLSCKADAIVIGTVKGSSSQIIEEGTFVFTDYVLSVDNVLKNNSAANINPNSDITVARKGGGVKLNNKVITAIDYSQKPLEKNQQYLLFLSFIPQTKAYRSINNGNSDDSFWITGEQIAQVSDQPLPFGTNRLTNLADFIAKTQTALSIGCNNQGGAE